MTKNESSRAALQSAMVLSGFPQWYTNALKATMVWKERGESSLLVKLDGSSFEFRKGTTYAITTKGVKSFFKVTEFMLSKEEQDTGPAGLFFLEWNGTDWVDQDSLIDYLSMTCLPGGVGRRGFIVDWNTVESWNP